MEVYFDKLEEVMDNCYLINKGVRSCYMTTVTGPDEDYESGVYENPYIVISVSKKVKAIEDYAKKEGLYFYSYKLKDLEEDIALDQYTYCCWIYKYPHQGIILKSLPGEHGFIEEWIVGKLLGYSDAAMEEFLSQKEDN